MVLKGILLTSGTVVCGIQWDFQHYLPPIRLLPGRNNGNYVAVHILTLLFVKVLKITFLSNLF